MITEINIDSILPPELKRNAHSALRHLYFRDRPGFIVCLFKKHDSYSQYHKAYPMSYNWGDETAGKRNVFGISYVLAGTGKIFYPSKHKEFQLEPGSIFQYNGFYPKDVILDVGPDFYECSISVDEETGRHLEKLAIWNGDILSVSIGSIPVVIQEYKKMYESITNPGLSSRSVIRQFIQLIELIFIIIEKSDPYQRFREEARAILTVNTSPNYQIQDAAKLMGLTFEAFRQRFRRAFGISPQEYQIRFRMEKACALLLTHSVKETALLLGYRDPFLFSRQFKKRIGVAPKNYWHTRK